MSKVAEMVEKLIEPYAKELGLDVVEVEYAKKSNGNNLTIFIYKVGGVTLDDCESLHRVIDEPLDELDPTNGVSYTLNVSSCGLDRPLKNLKDYLRNIGKKVTVKLYAPLNNKKVIEGVISNADDLSLEIELNNELIKINKELISTVIPVVEF